MQWKALRHPNVLSLLGVRMTENEFAMVSEWMPNGNINQFVAAHQDVDRFELVSPPSKFVYSPLSLMIMRLLQLADVARGLDYMHTRGVVHGALKGVRL